MTSKIKVDNIENQCGGAVVTKCGGTTTISGSVVKSNAIQASDGGNLVSQSGTTITLGASGDTVTLASGASQTGFGRTGTVDWQTTPKTATFTAVSGNGYFVNTTAGVITVNLPSGSAGAIVSLADYAATWQTNNVTVTPNGTDKIGSVNQNATLSTEGQSVTFVFVDSTQGWINTMDSTSNVRGSVPFLTATGGTITTSGNCKIHTFTGPGTFCVSAVASCSTRNKIGYMVVAGGGGAMSSYGGGAGAGGYREGRCNPVTPYTASPLATTGLTVTATSFPITVGGGGVGSSPSTTRVNGSNSVFSTITSAGGGKACGQDANPGQPGANGGSGGGNGHRGSAGGLGNTPPVSPPQGNNGGSSGPNGYAGDGGGGAGAAGGAGTPSGPSSTGGTGGAGVSTCITGSSVTRAGGGGGGTFTSGAGGNGGAGGGGNSGGPPGNSGNPGTANTGGGGGGGSGPTPSGGTGGSGIVIIRYKFQ